MAKTRIVIEAQDRATREIDKVSRRLQQLKQEGPRSINDLVKAVGRIPAPAALAAGALGSLAAASAKAYEAYKRQYEAEQRLSVAIRASAGGYDVLSGQLVRLASELQSLTQIDDQQILAGMTRLVDLGVQDVPRAAKALTDLSVVTGSVESAVELLGRALTEPERGLRALQRAGVQLTETERERIKTLIESGRQAEAQAEILGKVEARYQGIAREMGALPTKQIERLSNALGDALETLGRWVSSIPIVGQAISGIAAAVEAAAGAMSRAADAADTSRLVSMALRQLRETGRVGEETVRQLANVSDQTLGQVLASYDESNRQQRRLLQQQAEQLRTQIEQMSSEVAMGWAAVNRQRLEADLAAVERQIASLQGASTRVLDQIRAYRERAAQAQREEEERQRREQAMARAREVGAQYDREVEALRNKYIQLSEIERIEQDLARLAVIRANSRNQERIALIDQVSAQAQLRKAELEREMAMTDLQRAIRDATDQLDRAANMEAEFWRVYQSADAQTKLLVLDEIGKRYGWIKDQAQEAADATAALERHYKDLADTVDKVWTTPATVGVQGLQEIGRVMDNLDAARIQQLERQTQAVRGNLREELELRRSLGEDTVQYEIDRVNEIAAAERKLEQERLQSMQRSAMYRKLTSIAEATITGTQATLNALATPPVPNVLLASLTGALTAAKIAAIASEPIPSLAEGGVVKATPGGRIVRVAEAGRDEAVIPLDRAGVGRTVVINIGTLVGAPTRETVLTLRRELERLELEGV